MTKNEKIANNLLIFPRRLLSAFVDKIKSLMSENKYD